MTNQSDYQQWVELADKRPWDIGDRHVFCGLSLEVASKVEKLVDVSTALCRNLSNADYLPDITELALDTVRALKELTGK